MLHAALDATGHVHLHTCYNSEVVGLLCPSESFQNADRPFQNLIHVPATDQEYQISMQSHWLYTAVAQSEKSLRSFLTDGNTLTKRNQQSRISSM